MPEQYEREIEEIIKKTGDDLGPRTSLRQAFFDLQHRVRENLRKQTPSFLRVVTPRRVGAIGVALLVAAYFLKTPPFAVLAVSVLLTAYLISLVRGREGEQRWRGQPIDTRGRPNWLGKVKQVFRKKPRL